MKRFITFEGVEGSGKTTQMKMASSFLRSRGRSCLVTEEPGGTSLGRKIRRILLRRSEEGLAAETELLLFAAARAHHVRALILPALEDSQKFVLCDRFVDATLAYQGFGRGLDRRTIEELNRLACGPLKPDLTLLFDVTPEMGLRRAVGRMSRVSRSVREDRFENEALSFHRRVREGYLALAKEEPGRFRIIDGSPDIGAVHRQVCAILSDLFDI
ncbi:MAG: Thymidylate kinase [Syntrophaceae bacterium PtaU1.Bin231]|nr:MAG: Thymidylate kinase [Syntrophaceae bacterium PtaU1.Bin231]HOG18163.1 dTMP kinase [Syntrophales bacterium]